MTNITSRRLQLGGIAPEFTRDTLSHGTFTSTGPSLTHLQFRRFAGCPICSLHLRTFAKRSAEIERAEVRVAAVFHAPLESLRSYHQDLPFQVIGDPERQLYRLYGVEASLGALLHPRAIWASMKGLLQAPSNPLAAQGGIVGLPADFLVTARGTIAAFKYGTHADDQWSVDELLELAAIHRTPMALA